MAGNGQIPSLGIDPTQIAQSVRKELARVLPGYKAEWVKDVQATLVKSDFQAATLSSQLFKMDQSLFKWDEKGLTFAGKEVPGFKKFSLQSMIHGGRDAKKAAEEKRNKEADEKKAAEAREAEKERVKKFEAEITGHVRRARDNAKVAKDKADEAKHDAQVARNLLGSANQNARLAAGSADRARQSFAALEQRITRLEEHL